MNTETYLKIQNNKIFTWWFNSLQIFDASYLSSMDVTLWCVE